MFRFRKFRVLHDVDSGNGGGGAGGEGAGGGDTNPNPQGGDGTNPQGGNPNPQWNQDPTKKPPAKDPEAEKRYQTQRFRERAEKAEAELAKFHAERSKYKPTFDAESDPDGSKERQWEIDSRAQELLSKQLKELGIEDKLNAIQYEKEEAEFFEVVNAEAGKFKEYGIDAPTKDELKTVLTTLDTKGITPEQVIMLAKATQIFERMKSGGFKPWTGGKPNVTTPKSQDEINAAIYASTGAFGFGG